MCLFFFYFFRRESIAARWSGEVQFVESKFKLGDFCQTQCRGGEVRSRSKGRYRFIRVKLTSTGNKAF